MSKNFEYELLLRVEAAEKNIEHLASKMAKDFDRAGKKAEQAAEVAAKAHAKVFTNHAKMLDRIAKMEAEHAKELLDWQIKLATMRGKEGQRQWDAEQLRHKQVMDNAAAEEAARISANHAQILVDQKARDARQKGLESAFKAGIPLDLGMEKERNRLALVNAEIEKRIGSILDQNLKKKQDAIKAEERRLAKGQAKYDRIYGGGGVPLDKMEAKQAAQDAATTARIEAEQLSTYRQKLDFLDQMVTKYGHLQSAAQTLANLQKDVTAFGSQKMVGGGGTVAQTYNATPAAQADIDAKMEESIRKQLDGAKEVTDAQQHHRDVLSDVVKEHDKLKKNYTDPSSRQAIDDATDSFKKQAEAIENSSAPIADQKKQLTTLRKETKDGLNEQLKTMNVVTEKDKKANDEALERAKRLLNDRRTTDRIRYQNNEQILRSLEEAEARHNNVLGKLERDRLTMTKALYAERVQAAIAAANAESDALIQAGARQANADAAKAAGQGRVVSMVFQTQQALEDFSYAGIRGAANNIAMMASNMGGSGGIIALLGIGVVQAGSYFGWWEKINNATDGYFWKLQRVVEEEKKLNDLAAVNLSNRIEQGNRIGEFDLGGFDDLPKKAAEDKGRIGVQERVLSQLTRADVAYKSMEKSAAALDDYQLRYGLNPFEGWSSSVEETTAELEGLKNKLQEAAGNKHHTGAWLKDVEDFEAGMKEFNSNAFGFQMTAEGSKLVKEKIKEVKAELSKLNASFETTEFLMDQLPEAAGKFEKLKKPLEKMNESLYGTEGLVGGSSKTYSKLVAEKVSAMEAEQAASDAVLGLSITSEQIKMAAAAERNDTEELNKIGERINANIDVALKKKQAMVEQTERELEVARPWFQLQTDAVELLKEQEKSLERQLSTAEQLAEASRERALQARAATEEYKRTAALGQMELQDRRSDLVAKEKMDQIDKQAKAGMDWASNRKQGIEGWAEQRAKQLKAMGYNAGAVDSQLAAFKQRLNAEYEAFIKHGQAKVEAAKKQATDQAEAEKKAREDSYKQLETNRAGMLGSQAATAELGGDFDKALRLTKEREEVLKDLRAREVDKVGRGSLADTDAAIAQVRALDEMITRGRETTESLHEKIANKAEQDAAGFKQKLDEIIKKRQVIEQLDMTKQDDINKMAKIIQQTEQLLNLRVRLNALNIAPAGGVAPAIPPQAGIAPGAGTAGVRAGASVTVNNSFPVSTSAAMSAMSHHMANAAAASRVRQGLS